MIRFATEKDIESIMDFIDLYWKKNHILARDKEFFCFQHNLFHEISYVISLEDNSEEINGILGYIPYSEANRDVMLALWKVRHTADPTLGISMLQFLQENGDVRSISCPGIRKKTKVIYEYLGYKTGKMNQWYRLRQKDKYNIAVINNTQIPQIEETSKSLLVKINTYTELENSFQLQKYDSKHIKPYKSMEYIRHRYFEHPIYQYLVYGVQEKENIDSIVVFRIQEYNGSCVLRLVDCIGDYNCMYSITQQVDRIADEYNAEYADFYETGLDEEKIRRAGFLKVEDSNNIIPNFFAPYEQENVDIWYCSTEENIVLFKGDGDQDRPS